MLSIMKECYGRLEPHGVELVDLCLFERASVMEAFLSKEYRKAGVASSRFDEAFFALHDAWKGIPRITLCLEKMVSLPPLVQEGGIRHEVGHSVLHGSPQYYLISMPPSLLEAVERAKLDRQYSMDLLYLLSMAVKDYEVSRLLYSRGYVDDQVAYVKHLLSPDERDAIAWEMARGNPSARLLCLFSRLKDIFCAAPFVSDGRVGGEVMMHVVKSLDYLPKEVSEMVLRVMAKATASMKQTTNGNINLLASVAVEETL